MRVVPIGDWGAVYCCCSGSFRVDRAITARWPGLAVHSNDVSLLSCGIGAAATGGRFKIGFTGRLGFIEGHLKRKGFKARLAALLVALEMAKYRGDNAWARRHFAHYEAEFAAFLEDARGKLAKFLDGLDLASISAGDFRDPARAAIKAGAGVLAFPPTYKGGYERLYRFVEENTSWPAPDYKLWDPALLGEWVGELEDAGADYCLVSTTSMRCSPR